MNVQDLYDLNQTGEQVQSDLNKVEALPSKAELDGQFGDTVDLTAQKSQLQAVLDALVTAGIIAEYQITDPATGGKVYGVSVTAPAPAAE